MRQGDEYAYRHWLRENGMETIVQGALRLGAHKLLGERPHFGGKYSEGVIRDGIKTLEELKRPPPKPQPQQKRKAAQKWDDLGPSTTKLPPRRAFGQRRGFGQEDLKELRKAIKEKDTKRIAELTSKIGRPSFDE